MEPDDQKNEEFVSEMTRRRIAQNNERLKKYMPGARESGGFVGFLMKSDLFDTEQDAKLGFTVLCVVSAVLAIAIALSMHRSTQLDAQRQTAATTSQGAQ